ncbi:helix-turn-helix domain-containing protein [Microvirga tunisiensis]|uniref:Helix-turn-helix domain-containing protein n=1 Tax=Pannonibacter tanglangensis TaxID=2750084 RepID=A0ABW9ZB70_9HYPH|nr:helix-turn-helix domain-containing protein [Pannonibacter sp. XCT-34]
MTEGELAERLGVAAQTLRRWRLQGRGPAYMKCGDRASTATVRYRLADIEAWERSRVAVTGEAPAVA